MREKTRRIVRPDWQQLELMKHHSLVGTGQAVYCCIGTGQDVCLVFVPERKRNQNYLQTVENALGPEQRTLDEQFELVAEL